MDPQEYKIWQTAKQQGKDDAFIKGAIQAYRTTKQPIIQQEPKKTGLEKAANTTDTIFGAGKLGEAIGTGIAVRKTAKEQGISKDQARELVGKGPSFGQVGASLGQAALNFVPGAKAAKAASFGAKAIQIGKTAARGAAQGYAYDVLEGVKNKESAGDVFKPGATTIAGGTIPGGLGVLGGAKTAIGRGISEVSGSLTGQGRGGQKALAEAIQRGGNSAKLARAAMRGGITDEQIFNEANDGLGSLIQKRTKAYTDSLSKISDDTKTYDVSPVLRKLSEELDNYKIQVKNGALDFSQSPIRFDKKSQGEIQTIFDEMKEFGTRPGDRTAVGLDSLKRAFSDLYSDSSEARKFTSSMSQEVRNVLKQVSGYDEMSKKYAKDTDLIKSIQKDLSVSDRKSKDAALRKFSQVLRNDTDARKQLLQELDQATGGKLIPMVAGNLAKPVLPRGLTRPLSGLLAGGAGVSGASMAGVIKALIIGGAVTSPRLAGEITNALGLSKKYTKPIAKALNSSLLQFQAAKGIEANQEENGTRN